MNGAVRPRSGLGSAALDVLIEIHEIRQTSVYESICKAFMSTHTIHTYEAIARDVDEYPELSFLGSDAAKAIENGGTQDKNGSFCDP